LDLFGGGWWGVGGGGFCRGVGFGLRFGWLGVLGAVWLGGGGGVGGGRGLGLGFWVLVGVGLGGWGGGAGGFGVGGGVWVVFFGGVGGGGGGFWFGLLGGGCWFPRPALLGWGGGGVTCTKKTAGGLVGPRALGAWARAAWGWSSSGTSPTGAWSRRRPQAGARLTAARLGFGHAMGARRGRPPEPGGLGERPGALAGDFGGGAGAAVGDPLERHGG